MKLFRATALALSTFALTGCFESELEKEFKTALAQNNSIDLDGYEIDGVEFTSEEQESRRGYTMTSRNFILEYSLADDAIKKLGQYKDHFLVEYPEKSDDLKAAGVFRAVTDGVETEYDISFNKKNWNSTLSRKSLHAEEASEFVEAGSDRAKELTAEVSTALASAKKANEETRKALAEVEAEYDKLTHWRKTPKEGGLIDDISKAHKLLEARNDEILEAVNVDYNKELKPLNEQEHAEQKGKGWNERNAIRAKYRELKREVERKYQAVYEEKKLKTIPELDKAQKAHDKYKEEKEARIAALQKQKEEHQKAIWDSESMIRGYERWIERAVPEKIASAD